MVSDTDTPKVLYTLDPNHKGTDRTVPFAPLCAPLTHYPYLAVNQIGTGLKVRTDIGIIYPDTVNGVY